MSAKTKLDAGFLLSYDWLPLFDLLPSNDERWELLSALINRQRNGIAFPEFSNDMIKAFAQVIEPTIKRRLDGQASVKGSIEGTLQGSIEGTLQDSKVKKSKEKESKNKVEQSKNTRRNRAGGEGENESFNVFWKAYPKKQAKPQALKAFEKANPSPEELESMLKAIEEQKRSVQWQKDEGQFIPLPSTWLNQRRWEDESTVIITNRDETPEEFFAEALKGAI